MDVKLYDKERVITITGVKELRAALEEGARVWRMILGDGRKVDISAEKWACSVRTWRPAEWDGSKSIWQG